MFKSVILAVLFVPSIRAALSHEYMASALIAAKGTKRLKKAFKTFEKEQDRYELAEALTDVAKVQTRMPKVVDCLRMAHDPFPKDERCVNSFVHETLFRISFWVKTESFTNVITSFKPSDIKSLVTIRISTLLRDDAVDVLKSVMSKSPELITGDLPSWLASHTLDRNSRCYKPAREEAFKYLTSFATEDVLEKALTIVKRSEHYKVAYNDGNSEVRCCLNEDYIPQDLFDKLKGLLKLVKARNVRIKGTLTLLPMVLVELVLDYVHVAVPDCSDSSPRCLIS